MGTQLNLIIPSLNQIARLRYIVINNAVVDIRLLNVFQSVRYFIFQSLLDFIVASNKSLAHLVELALNKSWIDSWFVLSVVVACLF
jgi:hypothetical protein